jgi:hypothetical protein
MPMNAEVLAQEMLVAIGGEVTNQRHEAFRRLAQAIVSHIQRNLLVTSSGNDPQGGVVISLSTLVQ